MNIILHVSYYLAYMTTSEILSPFYYLLFKILASIQFPFPIVERALPRGGGGDLFQFSLQDPPPHCALCVFVCVCVSDWEGGPIPRYAQFMDLVGCKPLFSLKMFMYLYVSFCLIWSLQWHPIEGSDHTELQQLLSELFLSLLMSKLHFYCLLALWLLLWNLTQWKSLLSCCYHSFSKLTFVFICRTARELLTCIHWRTH